LALTGDKMDADSASLANKDSVTAAKALQCSMDMACPSQVQNIDMLENVDGNLDDTAQLISSENCSPATESGAFDKPADMATTVPPSTNNEVQYSIQESSQRMEVDNKVNADGYEEVCGGIQKKVNGKNAATCQSMDENNPSLCMTIEDGEENEPSPISPGDYSKNISL